MDDERQVGFLAGANVFTKGGFLKVARSIIVVVIKTALPYSDDVGIGVGFVDDVFAGDGLFFGCACVMRVGADGAPNVIMFLGDFEDFGEFVRNAATDGDATIDLVFFEISDNVLGGCTLKAAMV